jgi:small-conductance mechanosensitive channel
MTDIVLFHVGHIKITLLSMAGMLSIWAGAWILLQVFQRLINRANKGKLDRGRRHSLFLILQYFIYALALVVSLETAGIKVSVLLAGSAALLVGLGLGIQEIFRDIVSGVFLLFEGTVEVGHILQIDGQVCKVEEINLRTSRLRSTNGMTLIMPNHHFITLKVINWSHHAKEPARFTVTIPADYHADEQKIRKILEDCATEHPDVITNNPQFASVVRLAAFEENQMTFELVFWSMRKFEIEQVSSELRFNFRHKMRLAGLTNQ